MFSLRVAGSRRYTLQILRWCWRWQRYSSHLCLPLMAREQGKWNWNPFQNWLQVWNLKPAPECCCVYNSTTGFFFGIKDIRLRKFPLENRRWFTYQHVVVVSLINWYTTLSLRISESLSTTLWKSSSVIKVGNCMLSLIHCCYIVNFWIFELWNKHELIDYLLNLVAINYKESLLTQRLKHK